MAWGYWSATSVSDRGRSPRREKDKQQQYQSLHPHQHQQQQQQAQQQQVHQTQTELPQSAYGVQQGELGTTAPGCAITVVEEPPCSMMIQGGSFYSYSAAAAAASRRIAVEGPSSSTVSTGVQVLPREPRHVRAPPPGASVYPPSSPGSGDSAEYEQPLVSCYRGGEMTTPPPPLRVGTPHDDIFAQPGTSSASARSSKLQIVCDAADLMEEYSEAELEEMHNVEMIYAGRAGLEPTSTCRVHGPRNPPPEPAPSMSSLLDEGPSPFQFNEITWGR